jgi:hypothetical protein
MFDSQSPFDTAAKQPFLGQPARKKWSLFSTGNSNDKRLANGSAATEVSDYDSSDDYSTSEEEECEDYEAPILLSDDEIVVFERETSSNSNDDGMDDKTRLELAMKSVVGVNSDYAVLQERHSEFGLVKDSMHQINAIQNDLAALVDSQEDDIEAMASFSIETLGRTQAGLAHLLRLQQAEQKQIQRKKTLTLFISFMIIAYFFFGSGADLDTEDGLPQAP